MGDRSKEIDMKDNEFTSKAGIDLYLFGLLNDGSVNEAIDAVRIFAEKLEAIGGLIHDIAFAQKNGSFDSLTAHGCELGLIISDYSRHIIRLAEEGVYPAIKRLEGNNV